MPQSRLDALVSDARAIFEDAVRRVQADRLIDGAEDRDWAPRSLSAYDGVRVAGMGKAAMAMAGVVEARYPERVETGLVVVPDGYPDSFPDRLPVPRRVEVMEGGHPLPNRQSVQAGRGLLEHAHELEEDDLLLALVSGGGTALSAVPMAALDLADLKTTYHRLMAAGVPIHPANVVRKHLTQVGGGQLARAARPADVAALVVSDVVGDDMSVIASGPTVPDPSSYEDAMEVLYRHGLWHDVPSTVREHLAAGARDRRPETPTRGDECFEATRTTLIGSNAMALEAARMTAENLGYTVVSVAPNVEGEARQVGREHAQELLDETEGDTICMLWGGETTVTVTGDGTGGRNQEVALGAALALEDAEHPMVVLSGGTDGIDGPTDAAGAWATPETTAVAREAGSDPAAHLERNDSYPLFNQIDQLLRPGPTHTNVMDVQVGLVQK